MTNYEIIHMARQAWTDAGEGWVVKGWFDDRADALEAFAKLIAAKEREACASIADSYVSEEFVPMKDTANSIKQAIRARGEA